MYLLAPGAWRLIMNGSGIQLGKLLITFGIILVVVGAMFLLGDRIPWLKLGRLPGDISWSNKDGSVRVYLPLMTMLLLSLLLSLILWLLRR
jgi:hypothetical protein